MKPSEILDKAADLIEPEGAWTQRSFGRESPGSSEAADLSESRCFCAIGAIVKVGGGTSFGDKSSDADAAVRLLKAWLRQNGEEPYVAVFNDAIGRTQAEVITALRQAAALARKDGQ